MKETHEKFTGLFTPNTTSVPDNFFDELMPMLSGAELKVVLYIVRRTFGFKKSFDQISLSQMVKGITTREGRVLDHGTGLGKASVVRALKTLEEKGVIIRTQRKSATWGYEPTTYSIKVQPLSQNEPPPVLKMRQGGGSKRDIQETVIQETVTTVNVENGIKGRASKRPKTQLRNLDDLNQPKEKIAYLAEEIVLTLGDAHSKNFYALVASKVPESVIRRTLSEIKADGANNPAKVFTHRMKLYAMEAIENRTSIQSAQSARAWNKSIQRRHVVRLST